MRKGKNQIKMFKSAGLIVAGFLAGILLGTPAAHAAVEYLQALPSRNAIYVNGQQVKLEAYTINGANYVKLRDIGEAMGFNVYWDGAVQIDSDAPHTGEAPAKSEETEPLSQTPPPQTGAATSTGYTISTDHWSREDFSQQANPAVFTGPYTRELYNAICQTLVDEGAQNTSGYRYAYTMVGDGDYGAVNNLLGRTEGITRYAHHVPQNLTNYYAYLDYFAVSAETPEKYKAALDFIQPVIQKIGTMGLDREKVTYLNDYLKTLPAYKVGATAGIPQTFAPHAGELNTACGSYAWTMKFLCVAADIPCITISTDNHTWNLVYANGAWLHVDASTNDLPAGNIILLSESIPNRIDRAPEATAFLKELLVPGSTR